MADYTVGSLGSLISGDPINQSGTKIVFQKVFPQRHLKKGVSDLKAVAKSKVETKIKKNGQKITKSIKNVMQKKIKEEVAGIGNLNAVGKSWRYFSSREGETETDGLKDTIHQKDNAFARNAARRVHIKNNTRKHLDDPEREARTIFVGNIPYAHAHKKKLIQLFSNYGDVESARIRCVPLRDPRSPKKVAVIKKEFHVKRTSISAFVVFKTEEHAQSALQANGTVFHDHHLRIDLAKNAKAEVDPRKSVFIGNLKFETEEEDLWRLFSPCGEVTGVRIVRDALTSVSKGIAFVNFESPDAVELALQLNGETVGKRPISVQRYKAKPTQPSRAANRFEAQLPKHSKRSNKSNLTDVPKMKKKDKRKKHRGRNMQSDQPKTSSSETSSHGTEEEKVGSNLSPENTQQSTEKQPKLKLKPGNKVDVSFMGQKVEKIKRKKKKIGKIESKKKKIALVLTGKAEKKQKAS